MAACEIKLDSCPCVIETLPFNKNCFIIGCYELIEDNDRKGMLTLINDGSVIKESDEIGGGIFDLRVSENELFVATSNGFLRLYDVPNLEAITSLKLADAFLTSIDVISCKNNCRICFVSDSTGKLFVVSFKNNQLQMLQELIVTKYETSVWRVKVVPTTEGNNLIFVGSDDGSLKAYYFRNNSLDPKCVIQNCDASSGITAINSFIMGDDCTYLVTGSYDENLRIYQLNTISPSLTALRKVHVPGSGIWKIRIMENTRLLLAGMYSGIHEVSIDGEVISSRSFDDDSSIEKKQLIYDVIEDGHDKLLVASFYKRMLISVAK